MTFIEAQQIVQVAATLVGISGGLFGLYKYLVAKREKELREWQKVVVYKILRQNENNTFSFLEILEKYRSEAHAFVGVNLKKNEISEDSLRRILLELTSSNIVSLDPNDSYRLKIARERIDLAEKVAQINEELVRTVSPNPFVYTVDEVLKEICPKLNISIPLLRTDIRAAIAQGRFVVDDKDRIAFAK